MSEFDTRLPHCKLSIAGIPILYVNIRNITIREWVFDFVPTVSINFRSTEEFFGGINLQEDDIIEIELGGRPPEVRELPVKAYFKLKAHITDKQQEATDHQLVGILACTNLNHPHRFRSFPNKTSSKVFEQLAGELSFKPKINVASNDSMTWLQSGTALDFLKHLSAHSHVADDDLMLAFTNRDSKLTVTSLKTIEAEAPMILRHFPEAYAEDIEPNDLKPENKFYPFVGFTYKSITSLHNMTGGYGITDFSYDWGRYETIVNSQIVGTLAEFHQMRKELNGQSNKIIETEKTPSGHDTIMASEDINTKKRMDFASASAIVCVKPHKDYQLGKLVKLEFEFMNRGEKSAMDGIYGGNYIIGGIVHHHEHPIGHLMYLVLMRGGMERGLAMEESDISMFKE